MKNKLLVSAFAVALVTLAFTSCKEKTDFDAICDNLSKQTLKGYFSGAEVMEDDMVLNLIQFNFASDGTVERTVMALGDSVYEAPATRKFSSWEFGEYCDGNASRYLTLIPEGGGEPLRVKYCIGGILEENQPMASDKNNKVKDIATSQESITGKKWHGEDTVFFKIDTIINVTKYDTTYTYKPKKDDDGKTMKDSDGHVIYEQTIKSITETIVPTKMKWAIAPKTINVRTLELNRDASSYENTGKWYMVAKEYEMDSVRTITTKSDTLSSYDFHWSFVSYLSSSSFVIQAVQADGTTELFDIKFDAKVPSVTVDKQVLKVSE